MTEDESLRLCTEASPPKNNTKNNSSFSMTSPSQNNMAACKARLLETKNENNSKAGTSKDYSTEPRPGIAPKDLNNEKNPSFASTASSKSNSPIINGHKMYSSSTSTSTSTSSFTSPATITTTTTYKKINNYSLPEAARQSDESGISATTIHSISNGFSGLKTKDESSSSSNIKMNGGGNGNSDDGENGILCNYLPSCSKKVDEKISDNRFKCPNTDKFLSIAYPEFCAKHRENIEELIIDDMSLIIFKSMDDYKTFKIYEDKRRAKLEKVKKEKEENEIMRLAALKKEKLKSKYDAQKEKRKEKNRILKEQRTQERKERRERRERMRHSSSSLGGTNEFRLTKIERRQWKIEYLQRKQERSERREAQIKKQQEDKLRKEQSLSESLKSTNGTPVVATTVAAAASASIETLSSTIVASASSVAASVTTGPTPSSLTSNNNNNNINITNSPSLSATPCSSRISSSTSLMNDFSNSNIATEALATLANISSGGGGGNSTPQRLKRSANDNASSPTITRMNGVIFSPATKIPKLESISHSSVVKSEPNEPQRGVPLRSNIPNGLFKAENLPPGFDPSIFGSIPPATPISASNHSNSNDFSAAIATGTSKAAAQVATFMRNSQAPQLEIHQALAQNPQLALIFHQALAAMHQAVEPDPRNNPMGLGGDTKPQLPHQSLHPLHGNFPLHLPPGMPTLPAMHVPASTASTTVPRLPVPAPSQFPVTSSAVATAPPPVSTKPSIPFSTAAPTPTVSKAFNIGPLEAAVPPMPNKLPLPPIGIQFPPEASLGSQLAGAAMLAQQHQQQQQQQQQHPSTSSSSQPSQWCNKHVIIAHNICNRIKAEQAKAAANEQRALPLPSQIQRSSEPQSRQNIRPPLPNSMMPPPPTPQKQISNRAPLPSSLLPPIPTPQQTMLQNIAMQNAHLIAQNPAFSQWQQQMLRFPAPLQSSTPAPGITSGIPLQQNSAVNDFASQELAKLYRLNQSIKQEPGTSSARPPSHMVERSGSVAPGALSTGQNLPQVPTSMFMNQTSNPLLSNNPLAAFAAQQSNMAQQSLAGLMHPGSAESLLFSMLQQRQQHQVQQQQQQHQQHVQQQVQQQQQQHQQQQQAQQQQAQQQAQQQQQQQAQQQQQQAQQQHQQQLQLQQQLQQQQQQMASRMANPLMLNQLTSPFAAQNAGIRAPAMNNNPLSNLFASLERERLATLSMQSSQLGMPRAPFPQQQNLGAQSAANALQQMLRASEQQQQQQQQPATSQSPFLAGGLPNHAAFDLNAAAQFLPHLAQNSLLHAGNPLMRPPFHFLNNVSQAQAQNLLNMQSFGKMSFPPTQPNNNAKRDP